MTRGLIAKVAQTDWRLKISRKAYATFKRMSPRVISPPKAVGEVTGFRVSAEGPDGLGGKSRPVLGLPENIFRPVFSGVP